MGAMLFNVYLADLQSIVTNRCYQYADDTTLYAHEKPVELSKCIFTVQSDLIRLEDWEDKCRLAIIKYSYQGFYMLIATKQMSTVHSLDNFDEHHQLNYYERTGTNYLGG